MADPGGLPVAGTLIAEPVGGGSAVQVAAYEAAGREAAGARAEMVEAARGMRARQAAAQGVPVIRSVDVVRSGIAGVLSAVGTDATLKPNDEGRAEIRDADRNDDAAVTAPNKPAEGGSGQVTPSKPDEGGSVREGNGGVGDSGATTKPAGRAS